MKLQQVGPNFAAYSGVINACANGKMWDTALILLEEMRCIQLEADIMTKNLALSACTHEQQWLVANDVLDELITSRTSLDTVSFNIVMGAHCKAGLRWEKVLDSLER